jgi:hypothetical protein
VGQEPGDGEKKANIAEGILTSRAAFDKLIEEQVVEGDKGKVSLTLRLINIKLF